MATNGIDTDDFIWQQIRKHQALESRKVFFFQEVDSTNTIALDLGKNGEPHGTVIVAETQTKGRGRLGRKWESPPETGLYFSIILRPEIAPEDLSKITLAAGVALCRAIETETDLKPQIKWPNDILLDGKKLGGILAETGDYKHGEDPLIILGIGLNINTDISSLPSELANKCTSLSMQTGKQHSRGLILREIINTIEQNLVLLQENNFKKIMQQFKQRDAIAGKELSWVTIQGDIITGISLGIDEHGMLNIEDKEGFLHEVISGDITIVP